MGPEKCRLSLPVQIHKHQHLKKENENKTRGVQNCGLSSMDKGLNVTVQWCWGFILCVRNMFMCQKDHNTYYYVIKELLQKSKRRTKKCVTHMLGTQTRTVLSLDAEATRLPLGEN